ncbi:FkbM family methyltransferase [Nocardia cyriacigeorgica]|uniref:FkbM family methyltransferase n=1 Tax=Nocardia cyriacigeorgica TaxID=135487 RepID=UPI001892FAB2|nr:FkbM family methyltransferase [Nocardia cyriacigeorgica]MBF6439623.1 FkbM family methyltransferase [Nocardia cyriacigeorgica]
MASETRWAAGISDTVAGAVRGYVRYAPGTLGKGMLAARYLNPYLREHPREQQVKACLDTTFVVDSRDLIQRYIGLYGTWEPHLTAWLRHQLQPGDGFIDVGANIGYFAVVASRLVGPQGRVVAVEASPPFHEKMLHHIDLNKSTNVRAVNAAVSDKNESLTFVLASSHNLGANSIVPYDGPAEVIFTTQAQQLPELLEPAEIAQARVIKIDLSVHTIQRS